MNDIERRKQIRERDKLLKECFYHFDMMAEKRYIKGPSSFGYGQIEIHECTMERIQELKKKLSAWR